MNVIITRQASPANERIQKLESNIVSILGKERFEKICEVKIASIARYAATPLTHAVIVKEEKEFSLLIESLRTAIFPTQISQIFEKIFSLTYKTQDQEALEAEKKSFITEMQNRLIAFLEKVESKLICCEAVKERDIDKLKRLRRAGLPWGYKLLEIAKHAVEDPWQSISEKARSIAIMNWIDTEQDLEMMRTLEKKLEEIGIKGEELKMMHYSHAGMAQRFVDESKYYIFSPFVEAIEKEWRPSLNNAILEECFDKALEKYGKSGMPEWINQKNIRLKEIRTLQIGGLNALIDKVGALNKESKLV